MPVSLSRAGRGRWCFDWAGCPAVGNLLECEETRPGIDRKLSIRYSSLSFPPKRDRHGLGWRSSITHLQHVWDCGLHLAHQARSGGRLFTVGSPATLRRSGFQRGAGNGLYRNQRCTRSVLSLDFAPRLYKLRVRCLFLE